MYKIGVAIAFTLVFILVNSVSAAKIRISNDKTHFVDEKGEKVYLVGANSFGPAEYLLGMGKTSDDTFSVEKIENWFAMCKNAGVNFLRVWNAPVSGDAVPVIKHMAEKYGVYLYFCLGASKPQDEIQKCVDFAKAYGDSPMVIGYDLRNEPTFAYIMTRFQGQDNPVVAADLLNNYKAELDEYPNSHAWLMDEENNPEYKNYSSFLQPGDKEQLIAAEVLYRKYFINDVLSSFTLKDLELKTEPAGAFKAINDLIEKWIEDRKAIIRQHDPDALITVGYYNPLALWPANENLDFQNQHAYTYANAQADIIEGLESMDTLNRLFPNMPIMLGEFCYSGGQILKSGENEGQLADYHVAGVGEFMHYLYGFSKGYAGNVIWCLQEWNPANYRYDNGQYGEWEPLTGLRRERQGIYYYDGNLETKYGKKPLGHALSFFNGYLETRKNHRGEILVTEAQNQAGTGFIFRGENAEYIGNTDYDSDGISFTSQVTPIVMTDWNDGVIKIMATANTTAYINPSYYIDGFSANQAVVNGVNDGFEIVGEQLKLSLLSGETVEVIKKEEAFICVIKD